MDNNTETSTATAKWSDQYTDPRWQKKRLEILEYDNYTCRRCGDKESTLHVHHGTYIKGRKIWEYIPCQLITLCDDCHKKVHELKDELSLYVQSDFTDGYRWPHTFSYEDMHAVLTHMAMGAKDSMFGILIVAALEAQSMLDEERV